MRKYLVFYPVNNELGLDRHTFDAMTDEEAWKELQKSEWIRVYDMTRSDRNGRMLDMGDFVEDYNDEELDGGWWSVVLALPDEEEEERKFKAGEHVAVCDDKGNNYLAVVMYETWTNGGNDTVAVRPDDDGVPVLETDIVEARFIYQQSRNEVCPKCGKPLYYEHNLDLDYSYYCFHCDENFYDSEV